MQKNILPLWHNAIPQWGREGGPIFGGKKEFLICSECLPYDDDNDNDGGF